MLTSFLVRTTSALSFIAAVMLGSAEGGDGAKKKVDFDREVRPILSNKCFKCHGPDEANRQGGLRLDTPETAFAETESGATPIVPGNLEESEVFKRIVATEDDVRMPPKKSGKPLEPDELEKIAAWIEQGATFKRHWAFIPPVKPAVPETKDKSWSSNSIDAFILAKLEKERLAPSPRG